MNAEGSSARVIATQRHTSHSQPKPIDFDVSPADSKNWYNLDGESTRRILDSAWTGLSQEQAQQRAAQYGANEITYRKTPWWMRLLRQFHDPMVVILLIAAAITGLLTLMGHHMLPDTLVIGGVVLLNALLGFIQEGKAEGALDALRNMMVQYCMVIRGGKEQRLPARELVPGDILIMEGGDKVPADVRFLEVNNLHIDESSLTGESVPVRKQSNALTGQNLVPGDQTNMGFSGTSVTQGTARAIVVATGRQTAFGRIAELVREADHTGTPLQQKMREFVRMLVAAILIIGAFNFALGIFLGYKLSYSFLGAVSLVVAAIPEMLPALVTSVLALSGLVMARRKALIRRLPAAETLGATSVICSDKTGTLTVNRMTVTRLFAAGKVIELSGSGVAIEGVFSFEGQRINPSDHQALNKLLLAGLLCNNAHLGGDNEGLGDPTEIALKVSAAKASLTADRCHRLEEIPFDSQAQYMAVLVTVDEQRYLIAKGAPEVICKMCTKSLDASGQESAFDGANVQAVVHQFAGAALRTLGFAVKAVDSSHDDLCHADLAEMCFVGLQGMIDPPRQSAVESVAVCQGASIRTVMITGDHPATALAIGKQLGMPVNEVVTGTELARLNPERLRQVVQNVSVFARVAPEHKKLIAETLRKMGQVVAMTGDGVNDAPALKAADIGIAMGITGTEVAKESADMVLADDNFATIVAAVEEGRHAWNNLHKAILYTLPTNAAQTLLILGAVLMASFVPLFSVRFVLEPVQILWINLLDSVLLTMPLMMERKEADLLNGPPRAADKQIIDGLFLQRVLLMGLAISLPGFFVYYYFGASAVQPGQPVNQILLTQAQTAAFWGILLAHLGYVVSARSVYRSAFSFSPFSNLWLLLGIALSILIRFIPTILPAAAELFRTAAFPLSWWPLILLCFFPSFIAIEADKLIRRVYAHK